MHDYKLLQLQAQHERLRQLLSFIRGQVKRAEQMPQMDDLAKVVSAIESCLCDYLAHPHTTRLEAVPIQAVLENHRKRAGLGQTANEVLKGIQATANKITREFETISHKISKRQEYHEWVMQEFGTIIREYISPYYTFTSKYDEVKCELHVYVGTAGKDPLGGGHGHYIFGLVPPYHRFSRPPGKRRKGRG